MKNIFLISLLAITCAIQTSCVTDEVAYDQPEYAAVVYLQKSGIVDMNFYNVNKDMTYEASVCKGGTNPDLSGDVNFRVFTEEELASYNTTQGTSYQLLPADCYTLPEALSFEARQEAIPFKVTLKKETGHLTGSYILPLRIESQSLSINADKSTLILHPNIVTPKVSFVTEETVTTKGFMEGKDIPASTEPIYFPIMLDYGDNTLDFDVYFEKDASNLQTLVNQYNAMNETDYNLLPSSAYSFAEKLSFVNSSTYEELAITFNSDGIKSLKGGEYLLPIDMIKCELAPFYVDNSMRYILVTIAGEVTITPISVTGNNRTSNTPFEYLFDNDLNSYVEITSASPTEGHLNGYDQTYGVYFDFDLGAKYESFTLSYICKNAKGDAYAMPAAIDIYGSSDGITWKKYLSYDETYDDEPKETGLSDVYQYNVIVNETDKLQKVLDTKDVFSELDKVQCSPGENVRYIRFCCVKAYRWQRTSSGKYGWYTFYSISRHSDPSLIKWNINFRVNEIKVRGIPALD